MSKINRPPSRRVGSASELPERLNFVIWLSAKTLGTDSAKDLSRVLGKRQDQLSKWAKGKAKPEWLNIRLIAEAVGVDPRWLDDPNSPGAEEPTDFPDWFAAQRARAAQRKRA